ncbi:LOW QUALITY PROTEIN: hypothetical protein MXB_19 [Myxobolus squamalis]|nr:LOW QUALITY PROTEIN: hypothetical protein MXB_19 [Myxobolus squamalis]
MDTLEFPLDQEFDTRAKIKKIAQKIKSLAKSKHKTTYSFTRIPFSLDINKNVQPGIDQELKENEPSPSFNIYTSAQIETDIKSEVAECPFSTEDEKSTNWADLFSTQEVKETVTDVDTNKSDYSLIYDKNQVYDELSTTSNSSLFKDQESFKNVDSHSVPELFFESEMLNEVKSSYEPTILKERRFLDNPSDILAHSDPKILESHVINKESDESRHDPDIFPQFIDITRDSSSYENTFLSSGDEH